MKFVVDNQLPRALARLLVELGHDAVHVLDIELGQSDDRAIWAYATEHGYAVISKDADFADLALLDPHRVQVIWVRIGNCRRSVLLEVFKSALETIERKLDGGETLIELY